MVRRAFEIFSILLLVGTASQAQTFRGAINGTVTDPSGAVVAGANVKATNGSVGNFPRPHPRWVESIRT
jgi:hypothetical protein